MTSEPQAEPISKSRRARPTEHSTRARAGNPFDVWSKPGLRLPFGTRGNTRF